MILAATVAVIFVATILQSLSGFGFALIVMPVLTLVVGLRVAAPTLALIALTLYVTNVLRFRRSIDFKEVLRLGLASALGVPVGVWMLAHVNENLFKQVMGASLMLYAVYSFLGPAMSWRLGRLWVYPAGFLAGCLAGAYNIPGPPVIVYGSLRQWPRDEFRATLQTLFLINGLLVVSSHLLAGNVTVEVLTYVLYAVPALGLGILAGSLLDQRVDRQAFRKLVQAMVLVMGLFLVAGV
jgi:uncharacterized membrane protein YfcA